MKNKLIVVAILIGVVIIALLDVDLGPGYDNGVQETTINTGDFFSNLKEVSGHLYRGPGKILYSKYGESLESTKEYLKLETYDFTNQFFKTGFQSLSRQGIPVQIILENNKYQQYENTFKDLQDYFSKDENIELRSDDQMGTKYVHSKFTLNEKAFWIQTANLIKSSFESNREHFFYSEDEEFRESLNQLFDADWNGEDLSKLDLHPNLVVCPLNCRDVIKTLLESAESSIVIQTQYIVDDEILDILRHKSEEINLAIIVADTDDNQDLISYFGPGIARKLSSNYNHTKVILIDEKYLLLGSMNMSTNSLDNNREIGIILLDSESIETFLNGFKKDWERSL